MEIVHRVPVIDRMMEMLGCLERAGAPQGIRELAANTGASRSTAYRILNTLVAHDIAARRGTGLYILGPRLLALAAAVPDAKRWRVLTASLQGMINRLAAETGETVKLSVLDNDQALCVATAQGTAKMALAASIGEHFPLHAGAASKVLLAFMPEADRNRLLAGTLRALTARTVTNATALRAELVRVRRLGWAEDCGEYSTSVRAVAAPLRDAAGHVLGAMSIAHLADRSAAEIASYRAAVLRAAADIQLVVVGRSGDAHH